MQIALEERVGTEHLDKGLVEAVESIVNVAIKSIELRGRSLGLLKTKSLKPTGTNKNYALFRVMEDAGYSIKDTARLCGFGHNYVKMGLARSYRWDMQDPSYEGHPKNRYMRMIADIGAGVEEGKSLEEMAEPYYFDPFHDVMRIIRESGWYELWRERRERLKSIQRAESLLALRNERRELYQNIRGLFDARIRGLDELNDEPNRRQVIGFREPIKRSKRYLKKGF